MTFLNYPYLLSRIKALMIDGIVLFFLMYAMASIFDKFENAPDIMRICAMISVLLYDPIFTCLFGGTIGHFLVGIRVKQAMNEMKNISFMEAFARFIVKTLLGVFSFLTINSHQRKRAIHDLAAGSVVIYVGKNHDMSSFAHRSTPLSTTDASLEDTPFLNDNK